MKRFRISLFGVSSAIVLFALAFGAVRYPTGGLTNACYTLTLIVLLGSVLLSVYSRGSRKAFWFGFMTFGWIFFFTEIVWSFRIHAQGELLALNSGNGFGGFGGGLSALYDTRFPGNLTARLLFALAKALPSRTKNPQLLSQALVNNAMVFHLAACLAIALVGGISAVWIRELELRRRKSPPSKSQKAKMIAGGLVLVLTISIGSNIENESASPKKVVVTERYFPDRDPANTDEKFVDSSDTYMSVVLATIREPSLMSFAVENKSSQTFRFVWLPSFDRPGCIRIDRTKQGATVRTWVFNGTGSAPGGVAMKHVKEIDSEQWFDLEQRLEKIRFWKKPEPKKPFAGEGGDSYANRTDGDSLLVEGVKGGEYKNQEYILEEKDEEELCHFVLVLTGLDIEETWQRGHGLIP